MSDMDRTKDVLLDEDVSFESLMLSKKTLEGIHACGFKKPSPIQLRAVPLGRCGFDLIVEAKSGTGKTAVFGIIGLEMLSTYGSGFQILILAPTREIASQIGHVLQNIGQAYKDLKIEIVIGGTNLNEDIERLKKNKYQILVGSPGRILHLVKLKAISLKTVRLMVLDEADKLMEESFQKDINYIYSHLPERKQLIAASATYTPELRQFLHKYMQAPSHIQPYTSSILIGVTQKIVTVPVHGSNVRQNKIKFDKLIEILSQFPFKQSLIFCRYQVRAQSICELLNEKGWPTEYLASCQAQVDRLNSLKKLQTYSCRILVATDLAARGIDATNVDLVINLDAPSDSATYLHRIGRSGRYGSKGTAITIVTTGDEEKQFLSLLNSINNTENVSSLQLSNNDKIKENELKSEKNDNSNENPVLSNTNCNMDYFISLMSFSGNPIELEQFDQLVSSLNDYKCENKLNGDINNKEKNADYHFDIEHHIKDINYDLSTYLKMNGFDAKSSIKQKNDFVENCNETSNHAERHENIELHNISKTRTSLHNNINNKMDTKTEKRQKSRKKENSNKIKIEKMQSSKQTKLQYNGTTERINRPLYQENTNNLESDNQFYILEDQQSNWGLNEYYEFKRQLDMITSQIQHSVYISTLLNEWNLSQ